MLRDTGKIIYPGHGIVGCNGRDTQGIDLSLDEDFADGLNGLLQGCGAAIEQQLFGDRAIQAPLMLFRNQLRRAFAHVPDSQSSRYRLSKDRGCCAAQNAEAQQPQENQIQQGIENGGEGQKFQRRLCISHALQTCGQSIVAEGKGCPQKGDPKIGHGDGVNLRRNL